jgi:serine/threonine-protein kinase RsbW
MSDSPPDSPERRQYVLHSSLSELDHVIQETQAFAEAHTTDQDLIYRIVLLTTEAVTNAVEHGNKSDPSKAVRLEFVKADEHIEISVEDEGEGFDPDAVADPRTGDNLYREGGRGIFLITSMADAYHFEAGGRRLRMIFRSPV